MKVEYNAGAEARVADYLRRVRERLGAAESVDAEEVANDLQAHIERELSEMRQPVSEADVSGVLARLGPPEQVVSEEDMSQGAKVKMLLRKRRRRLLVLGLFLGAVWGILALAGYNHVLIVRDVQWKTADFVVAEDDRWTLATPTEIRASSTLWVEKHPTPCKDVVIQFPFEDVVVNAVHGGSAALPFSKKSSRSWRIDLSSWRHGLWKDQITVDWSFPASRLAASGINFRFPLNSLLPSASFKLMFGLAPDSGYRFRDATTSNPTFLFSGDNKLPTADYGSCGSPPLEKAPPLNEVAPSSAPTASPAQRP
jgi:hypothetical protein